MRTLPAWTCLAVLALGLSGPSSQAEEETVLERWSRSTTPETLRTLPPLERELFQLLTTRQLKDYLAGASAESITLRSGKSLNVFLAEKGALGFALPWSSIDGGGGTRSMGGAFAVSGTIGQPDTGNAMLGGAFVLEGGFLAAAVDRSAIFDDGFESGDTSAWSTQ